MQENIERGTFEIEKISQFETEEDPLEKLLRYLNLWLKRSKTFPKKNVRGWNKNPFDLRAFSSQGFGFQRKMYKNQNEDPSFLFGFR